MVVSSERIPVTGETLLGDNFFTVPGGKGANQAVAAAKLGADVMFVTRLGTDAQGDQLYSNFKACGVDLECILRSSDYPTGIAIIVIDKQGNNIIVVAPGSNGRLSTKDVDMAESKIASAGVVVAQLEIPLETVLHAAQLARRHNVPFILDPAPARQLPPELLHNVEIIKPNETEAQVLTGIKVVDESSAAAAANKLLSMGVKSAIITMSCQGFLLASRDGCEFVKGLKVKAVDSTAAGDAFTGALAFGLSNGKTLKDAAVFANRVAAISVTKKGAQSSLPTMSEVNSFVF
jgi:ribokinase